MKQNSFVKSNTNYHMCFTILMALVWSDSILLPFVRVFLMKIPYIWIHVDMAITILYVGIFFLAIAEVIRELYVKDIVIIFGFCAVFGLHYLLFPLNKMYYEDNWERVLKEVFPRKRIGCCFGVMKEKCILWVCISG